MKTYDQFWEELKPAYPLTKWEIKIPIATSLEEFSSIDLQKVTSELDKIMQQIFLKKTEARSLAEKWYDKWFSDLYEWHYTGIVRFDCMIDANNNLKLVEANTNWPDGLLMHDITYSVLSWTNNTTHLDLFLQFFNKDEYIFILYEKWWFEDVHFLEYEKIKSMWYTVWIWAFDDIEFKDNAAFFKDKKIDTMRLSMNSGRFTKEEYVLLKSAKLKFINTFDMAGFADKSLLAWIDNPMIMKTSVLNNDTKNTILQNKNSYVIKPTNLNEWIWVYIWVDMDQKDRESLIEKNINANYLAQEYITISMKKSSLYQDGGIIEDGFYYDFCPHLFYKDGILIGVWHVLVRYSKNKIVNVLRWWGIWYYNQK